MKIFWSWQDDSSGKTNRHFIKGALDDAVKAIEGDYEAEDASRPELDHDTKGIAGAKEIVPTLMAKIAGSVVFVADVTPIGKTDNGKALPNPNVMVELGWSLNKPGDGRQIYILNTADGWRIEQLPFDIRHRRVLCYNLTEAADKKIREQVRKELVKDLTGAIRIILEEHLEEKAQSTPAIGVVAKANEPSIWAGGEDGFKHTESVRSQFLRDVAIPTGARAYMRVIPTGWKVKPPNAAEIRALDHSIAPDAYPAEANAGNLGVTKDGFVRYWRFSETGAPVEAKDVSMYFADNGEFWILNGGSIVQGGNNRHLVNLRWVFEGWATALRRIHWLFDARGAFIARRVEVGFTGMENVSFPGGWNTSYAPSLRDALKFEQTRRDWTDPAVQAAFLAEAFDKTLALFGLDPRSTVETQNFLLDTDPERQRKNPYS